MPDLKSELEAKVVGNRTGLSTFAAALEIVEAFPGCTAIEADTVKPDHISTLQPSLSRLYGLGVLRREPTRYANGRKGYRYWVLDKSLMPPTAFRPFNDKLSHALKGQTYAPHARGPNTLDDGDPPTTEIQMQLPLPEPSTTGPAPQTLPPAAPAAVLATGVEVLVTYGNKRRAISIADARELYDQLKIVFGG